MVADDYLTVVEHAYILLVVLLGVLVLVVVSVLVGGATHVAMVGGVCSVAVGVAGVCIVVLVEGLGDSHRMHVGVVGGGGIVVFDRHRMCMGVAVGVGMVVGVGVVVVPVVGGREGGMGLW